MAKQRNSLGVVVLPSFEETISWEEYKKRTGIDLDSIFIIYEDSIWFRPRFGKMVVIDSSNLPYVSAPVPTLAHPNFFSRVAIDDVQELRLAVMNNDEIGYYIALATDRTIGGGIE